MILLLLLVILAAMGLIFPKSKKLYICIAFYMVVAIGLRTNSIDYDIYRVEYFKAPFIPYRLADFPNYNLLMNFCIKLGINYETFVFLIALVSTLLMLVGLYKISVLSGNAYISFALALFLIYPFGHEAVQIRTYLVDSIEMFALPYLLNTENNSFKKIRDYILYFLIVYVASGIHSIGYFFLAIGLFYILLKSIRHRIAIIIIGTAVISLLVKIGWLNSIIMSFLNSSKQDHWLESSNSSLANIFVIVLTIFIWLTLHLIIRFLIGNVTKLQNRDFVINLGMFADLSVLIIPLLLYDITFDRLWRIFLLILYLISGQYIYTTFNSRKIKIIKFIYLFLAVFFILSVYLYENEYSIVTSVLNYNYLFN